MGGAFFGGAVGGWVDWGCGMLLLMGMVGNKIRCCGGCEVFWY